MTSGLVDGLTSATSGLVDNSGCLSVTVRHWQCPYIGTQAPVSVACSDDLISYQKFLLRFFQSWGPPPAVFFNGWRQQGKCDSQQQYLSSTSIVQIQMIFPFF